MVDVRIIISSTVGVLVLLIRRIITRLCIVSCSLLLPVLLVMGGVSAEQALITQGFKADDPGLVTGALVSLKNPSADTVELSNTTRAKRLVGVVSQNAFLELSDSTSSVQVVTSGPASILVSDINGEVKAGDKISPSPIAGVGMKATASGVIIGTAQSDFGLSATVERAVTNQSGAQETVRIGFVPAQVNVAAYILNDRAASTVPSFLQGFANSVAGRTVSPTRVLIATLLTVLLFVGVTVLLYSSVRASIISIGRNPLSESALRRSLWQVGLTVAGVIVAGLLAVYLVLRL